MPHVIALDVHKRETQACIANTKGEIIRETRFRTTRSSYRRVLNKYARGTVIIETVGFYRPVAKWLHELDLEIHLAHLAKIPKPRLKTDKKDARHLLRLFRGDALPSAYLPPEETQRLRDTARHRMFLGQESRRLKAKIKHELYKHGHFVEESPVKTRAGREWIRNLDIPELSSSLGLWEHVLQEMDAAEERIESETTDHPVAQLLMSVPGIGAYTALLILAEVGDFNRFEEGDQVGSYAGLVPVLHQSGDTDRKGSITKEGNPVLRWALVEAARNHTRLCPGSTLSKRNKRLKEKKGNKKAIVATARQLGTVIYTMVQRGEEFKVNP